MDYRTANTNLSSTSGHVYNSVPASFAASAQSTIPMTNVTGNVTGVSIDEPLANGILKQLPNGFQWEGVASSQRLIQQVQDGLLRCDVVLLDASVEKPIVVSQQVHGFDKTIPVVVLTQPEKLAQLRSAIMFAPLLGNEVTICSLTEIDDLVPSLVSAVERHRQRRHYLDTIASAQPKLGNLTLSQPELRHYLGRLLDQAPIGVVSLDAQGCIFAVNRRAAKLLGITERDAPGRDLAQFLCKHEYQRFANLLMRSAVSQVFVTKPEVFETVQIGTLVRYLEATASPIAFQTGRRGYMVILQDVTARERAVMQRQSHEALMRKLSSALEQAADSVMITDENRVIEYVNPAFEALTGYSREEAIGQKTYFLRSGVHDEAFYGKLWRVIGNGKIYRGVLTNRKKNGDEYHEEKTITPLRNHDGEITHYVSTGRDISDRLNAEKAASRHQAELTHVSRLSTLGEMTSGLAHELNQPLCAITTYAQTCLRVIDNPAYDKDKLRYGLEQVVKQAELAGAIFKRLRNFARKDELQKRTVALLDVVNEVSTLCASELTEQSVSLEIDLHCDQVYIMADPIQLEQVMLNLLRNSMDAVVTLPIERKKLNISSCEKRSGEVSVSLSDKGVGCDSEVVERLFEPFYTTKPNGLGIGLGISQSIIEAHGGRLFLESSSGAGTTFCFTLPLCNALAETSESSNS